MLNFVQLHWEFFPSQSDSKNESCCPNNDPYTSSHFDSFKKKNESVWPRKTESDWLKFHHDSVIESSWLEKVSIVSDDSVFESIDSKTESLPNLSQSDSVLWWLINWFENWVTKINANFSSQLDSITESWWNLS